MQSTDIVNHKVRKRFGIEEYLLNVGSPCLVSHRQMKEHELLHPRAEKNMDIHNLSIRSITHT
ncbi:hypothetical protein HMPREF9134_01479 [Porphyromonas catoniae F0037]|uniref:Uncharacterized protein n=1 Tax=Porphyromonas catoniae F0037 TaxID=1127696 RepID=L1N9F6_9PORP|nr:hypothetical protein HMPREF9134_01479 [Porphyromonas catoniae F0037]